MPTSMDIVSDSLIRHQLMLIRYFNYRKSEFISIVNGGDKALIFEIYSSLRDMTGSLTTTEQQRWTTLNNKITKIRKKYLNEFSVVFQKDLISIIDKEIEYLNELFTNAIPIKTEFEQPTQKEKDSIIPYALLFNKTFSKWYDEVQYRDNKYLIDTVQNGYRQGLSVEEIIAEVEGTKRVNYRNGKLNKTRNNIASMTSTVGLGVVGVVSEMLRENNLDYFRKWFYDAILDGRTSDFCLRHNTKIYPQGIYNPIPPNHHHCRSKQRFLISHSVFGNKPLVRVESNRFIQYDFKKQARLANITKWRDYNLTQKNKIIADYRTKWMNDHIGVSRKNTTYKLWFNKQPITFQKDYLGTYRYGLYKQGNFNINNYIGSNNQKLTLKELYHLYGYAGVKSTIIY